LTSGAGYSYIWSNGETTQSISVTTPGIYAVQVTNANGCQSGASATTVVNVNALPATPTITAGGSTTFCDGASVTLTSSAESIYIWSNGETTQSINVTTPGSFTVQVKNASGCQSAMSTATVVTVNALPETPTITVSGPTIFCDGNSVTLTSSAAVSYLWSNREITQSKNVTLSGSYTVQVTNASGCKSEVSEAIRVTVNPLPIAAANSNSPICVGDAIKLTSSGGAGYIWNGPEGFTSAEQNPSILDATSSMSGRYMVTATSLDGCTGVASLSILVNEYPLADAGPDQELGYINSTQMQAVITGAETGEWSLISGSGNMLDLHSPTTSITGLSNGENIFSWKVQNGNCEASAEVKLIVIELFIPSVITPNGDDKNDYFKIREIIGQAELIIFNRWGNEEYTNDDYKNDWDGRNNKGVELPNDTYFYVLKLEDGNIRKGSVLIKR
jgi:gliding motility-associated-like protein